MINYLILIIVVETALIIWLISKLNERWEDLQEAERYIHHLIQEGNL